MRTYQRRHLRAPFKETVLYADNMAVHKARALNISEAGLLLDQLPNFPDRDEIGLLLSIPQIPSLKNLSLLRMQTFSSELFQHHVIRVWGRMIRKEELSQNIDNIFRSRVGVMFTKILAKDQRMIEGYVLNFSSNLIYLQTLIDSFNTDDETKERTRALARILGYHEVEKIASLRARVSHDYKSLQWN